MTATMEMLKPTEAATVASVSLRDVNRAIDERILPEDFFAIDKGRSVVAVACPLISFYFASAGDLTAEKRLFAIHETISRLKRYRILSLSGLADEDWIIRSSFLTIDLGPFVRSTTERMARLTAARTLISIDPDILSGTPVILGTRIPVYDIAASLRAGIPIERILRAYPALDAQKIELAKIYAEANPPRGRPRASVELPPGTMIITDIRVPRRRKPI